MMKHLMAGVAICALTISAAVAQQSSNISAASGAPEIVASQQSDQWLASKFKGTEVLGANDKKIGDVKDILFDKEGKILAYVVSAGGFLGMGSKEVALAPTAFQVVPGQKGESDKLKTTMGENDLKQAQNFKPYEPPSSATTGSGATAPTKMNPPSSAPSGR